MGRIPIKHKGSRAHQRKRLSANEKRVGNPTASLPATSTNRAARVLAFLEHPWVLFVLGVVGGIAGLKYSPVLFISVAFILGAFYRSKAVAGLPWSIQLLAYSVVTAFATFIAYWAASATRPHDPTLAGHSHIAFMQPGEVVGGSALLPFHQGEIPALNVFFTNAGEFPITSTRIGAVIEVVPMADKEQAWEEFKNSIQMRPRGGELPPFVKEDKEKDAYGAYGTFETSAPLSQEDVAALTPMDHPTKTLCVLAKVDWSDTTGNYETDMAQCIGCKSATTCNWTIQEDNNREIRLGI